MPMKGPHCLSGSGRVAFTKHDHAFQFRFFPAPPSIVPRMRWSAEDIHQHSCHVLVRPRGLTAAATRTKSPARLFACWWQLLLASCAHLGQLGEGEEAEVLDQIQQAQTRSPTMSSAARDGLERTAQRAWLQKGHVRNYEPAAANHGSAFQDHTSSPGQTPATPAPRHCTGAPQRPHVVEDPCA